MDLYAVLQHQEPPRGQPVTLGSPYGPLRLDLFGVQPVGLMTAEQYSYALDVVHLAGRRMRAGQLGEAENLLRELVRLLPYAEDGFLALAEVCLRAQRPVDAVYFARQGVALNQSFVAMEMLGRALVTAGQLPPGLAVLGHLWNSRQQTSPEVAREIARAFTLGLQMVGDLATRNQVVEQAYAERLVHADPGMLLLYAEALRVRNNLYGAYEFALEGMDLCGPDTPALADLRAFADQVRPAALDAARSLSADGKLRTDPEVHRLLDHKEPPRSPAYALSVTPWGMTRLDYLGHQGPPPQELVLYEPGSVRLAPDAIDYYRGALERFNTVYQANDTVQCLEIASDLARRFPHEYQPYSLLVDTYLILRQPEEALYYARQAFAGGPSFDRLLTLAKVFNAMERPAAALRLLAELWELRDDPGLATDRDVLRNAAFTYLFTLVEQRDHATTVRVGVEAMRLFPKDAQLGYELACGYAGQEEWGAARGVLDEVEAAGLPDGQRSRYTWLRGRIDEWSRES
jgi:tetratricopeptide (TPR) repeat protein